MLSHLPPEFENSDSVEYTYKIICDKNQEWPENIRGEPLYTIKESENSSQGNRGIKNLTRLYRQGIDFSVSGHFHRNIGASDMKKAIPTEAYSKKLHINPGAVKNRKAGFITINNRHAMYQLFEVV